MTGPEIGQMLLDQDGYIVMASDRLCQIGDVIQDKDLERATETPGPFVVIGSASLQDAARQIKMVPEQYRWPLEDFEGCFLYKVIAE